MSMAAVLLLLPASLVRQRAPTHAFGLLARSGKLPRMPLVRVLQKHQLALSVTLTQAPTKTEDRLEAAFLATRIKAVRRLFEAITDPAATVSVDDGAADPNTLLQILASDDTVISRLLADVDFRISALGDSQGRFRQDLDALAESLRDLNYRKMALAIHKDSNDIVSYNAILSIYANSGDYEAALAHIKGFMDKHGLQPNAISFAHMIKAYGVAKKPVDARKWFDVYRDSYEPANDLPYANMIAAYVNSGDFDAAENVWSTIMPEDTVPLTTIHMAAFMDALLHSNLYSRVFEWYYRLLYDKSGRFPKPDDRILDIVFDAALKAENETLIENLWPNAPSRRPSTLSLCIYGFNQLSKSITKKSTAIGMQILKTLVEKKDNLVYPVLPCFLEALIKLPAVWKEGYGDGDVDLDILRIAASFQVSPRIMQNLVRRAIGNCGSDVIGAINVYRVASSLMVPDTNTNMRLLKVYLDHGLKGNSNGLILDRGHFDVLLPIAARKERTMFTTLDDMALRGVKVTSVICDEVVKRLRAAGETTAMNAWIFRMRENGVIQGPLLDGEVVTFAELNEASTKLVSLCKEGRLDRALRIYSLFREESFAPTLPAITTLIVSLFSVNRVDEAVKVSSEMLEKPLGDVRLREYAIFNALIEGWIRVDEIPEPLKCIDHIIKTHKRLPHYNQMANIVAKTANPKYRSSNRASLPLVGKSIIEWLKLAPQQLEPKEVDPESPFSSRTLSDIVYILSECGEIQEALKLYRNLKSSGRHVSYLACKSLIVKSAYSMDKEVAMEVFNDAKVRFEQISAATVSTTPWNSSKWLEPILIMHLKRFDDLKAALEIWNVIKEYGFRISGSSCRMLIEKCLETGDFSNAAHLILDLDSTLSGTQEHFIERFLETCDVESLLVDFLYRLDWQQELRLSQKSMEVALGIYLCEKATDLVVIVANVLLKNHTSATNSKLSTDLIIYLVNQNMETLAFQVLESMTKFSKGGPNARNLEALSVILYKAVILKNDLISSKSIRILESDGFSQTQIKEVKRVVEQIQDGMKDH
ncbi:hypothetical protein BDR26DRAFT_859225 [Obelidium mucronatum]|nr:hypothetical protein BDR26DRAFT_859225 [Obelidium mucronatum]